ncbi:CTP synthase C-terminal region-related (seleno)protein [Aphanothece sacrum]|uniref:CTP synthase (glutamine hydrolyzing) n=1 Tax=Aphanothece sacrum FPU1 TaxID=1920663 RepID=A0A401IMY6_APHSA|nr:CTP synthase [Aphanothece sacrum]GBF82611.1 CTP synthase [Aphanothece sacrum FPU1]GBF84745.1 CTP synthase [Aphanothece sacrum FPU3]
MNNIILDKTIKVALIGEYNPAFKPHIATDNAISHSAKQLGINVESVWVSTEIIKEKIFDTYHGVWIAPGSPYKNLNKTLWVIRYARENHLPCLGTCGGFQHIIIEYARNVLGFQDAQHAEYDPYASNLFISQLDCSLVGQAMKLKFTPESKVANIYKSLTAVEQYYCNFALNPDYIPLIKSSELRVTGGDSKGEVRVIELPDHPFFVGTLFVPQVGSTDTKPHPLVTAFLQNIYQLK